MTMKRFSLLLLAVLMVCMLAVTVGAAESNENSALPVGGAAEGTAIQHCLCGNHFVAADGNEYYKKTAADCLSYTHADGTVVGCDGTLLTWEPWTDATAMPNNIAGNYYLVQDVTMSNYIVQRNHLNIDLNGKTLESTNTFYLYFVGSSKTVNITDSVGTGVICKADGTGIATNGGFFQVENGSTLRIFGGTVDGKEIQATTWGAGIYNYGNVEMFGGTIQNCHTNNRGGAMHIISDGVFNMYGGVIKDNMSYGDGSNCYGGNIYIANGTMNMYGGTIENGYSLFGGNIVIGGYKSNYGSMNMYGGTIQNGTGVGANIYMEAAATSLNISGGKIIGGIARNGNWGGNLAARGTVTMTGGEISGGMLQAGSDTNYQNANVYIGSTFNMSGGVIDGRTCIYGGTLSLSGDAKIWSDAAGANQLTISGGSVAANALEAGAKIGITSTDTTKAFATVSSEADKAYFRTDYGQIVYKDGGLWLEERIGCVCGGQAVGVGDHVCADVTWTPWNSTTSLPNTAGNYYLTDDVEFNGYYVCRDTIALDLNGHTVTQNSNMFIYRMNDAADTFSITDSVGGGKIVKADGAGLVDGALIQIWAGTVKLYGGTMDGGENTGDVGGGILSVSGGNFDMYGGTVQNGYALFGGNIRISSGTMNLYGGTVQNGEGVGANIYVEGSSVLNISGGKILNGIARNANWGGNLGLNGATVNMSGGEISGGSYEGDANYANANVQIQGTMNLSGGSIDGRVCLYSGTLNLSGDAKIWSDDEGANQLKIYEGTAKVNALSENAKIGMSVYTNGQGNGVDNIEGIIYAADGYTISEADQACCVAADGYEVVLKNNTLQHQVIGLRQQCICGGKAEGVGDHICEEVHFLPWSDTENLPRQEGNYYLTDNVTTAQKYSPTAPVALDLNGKIVTHTGKESAYRLYANSTLSITDSVGGGKIIKAEGENPVVYSGGLIYQQEYSTLNLFAGIIDGANIPVQGRGGVLCIYADSTFNMYGGTIQNGNAVASEAVTNGGFGGNINIDNGTLNLYAGTIQSGTGYGGNIFAFASCEVNIFGGKVIDGNSQISNWGGNLAGTGAFTVSGGEIYGGKCLIDGEYDANSKFSNVAFRNKTFTMTGGWIDGRMGVYYNTDGSYLNLSGTAKIWSDDEGALQLSVEGATVTVGTLAEGAKIGITSNDPVNAFATAAEGVTLTEADAAYFIHDSRDIILVDNALYLKKITGMREYNVILSDQIGMGFRVEIHEDELENTVVTVLVNGKTMTYTHEDMIAEDGYYRINVGMAAAQMMDVIDVTVAVGDDVRSSGQYTVYEYAKVILAGDYTDATKALVKEMLNYGATAQLYFGYNDENLATGGVDMTGVGALDVPAADSVSMSIAGEITDAAFYGATLVHKEKIAVRFYFTGDLSGCSFLINEEAADLTPVQKGDYWYVEISDINPQDLNKSIALSVVSGEEAIYVTYGPMNYIARVSVSTQSEDLKAMLKALYNYYEAAYAYVNPVAA